MTSAPQTIYLKDYQPPHYLIETVDLEFMLDEEWTTVKSHLVIASNSKNPSTNKTLVLDGENQTLIAISLDGKLLEQNQYQLTHESLTIFNVPDRFTLDIETRIKPQDNTALSGLYKSSGNFCTQCEPHGFRRITYFIDRPDVMAIFTTTIIADEKRYPKLLSNGNCISTKKISAGKHTVTWKDPFKKPCYLFALVAGDFDVVEDYFVSQSGRRITLRIFVEKGNQGKCVHAMQALKKAMRWDEERFGREYDLDIYMIVAVSDFNMGAMENKGLNIFNTQYILAKPETATDLDYINIEAVIAHEYFHNWSGNRITCRDWFQLSLKEGLTIFRDQLFTGNTTSEAVARINDVNDLRNTQFPEDSGPLAHAVQPDSYVEINNFYTTTVYNKGAEVIRMQQTILGDALFRGGMDLYFSRYDGQAVTIEEFVKSMENASGVDLKQFRLWYKQAGTPNLDISDAYDPHQEKYTLTIKQTCLPTPGQLEKKPMHIPIKIGLFNRDGREIVADLLHLKENEQTFHFENIKEKPIPSLLRGFSAPVKMNFPYTDDALLFLVKHDTDSFNRYDAGQRYAINLILHLIKNYREGLPLILPADFTEVFKHLMDTVKDDNLLLTEFLTLPSEKYIAEQMPVVDVDGIHEVREFLLKELAIFFRSNFIELYKKNHQVEHAAQFNMKEVGLRQIKNLSLAYLSMLDEPEIHEQYILRQLTDTMQSNMTDATAALRCLVNISFSKRKKVLDQFYSSWKNDPLVIDKWFSIQATSKLPTTLQEVKQLIQHPAFDLKNPNKVYALIGAFGHRNPVRFHAGNGEGYQFLTDCVMRLDRLNPQVAARMIKPLSDWKRYDSKRQVLMREQLELFLKSNKISKDVFEIVSKSLGE